jgi:hypothetical protein
MMCFIGVIALMALTIGTAALLGLNEMAIPLVIGLWLMIWPSSMFYGSRTVPAEAKLATMQRWGMFLLIVSGILTRVIQVSRM